VQQPLLFATEALPAHLVMRYIVSHSHLGQASLLLLLPRPCRKGLKLDGSNPTLLYGYGEDSSSLQVCCS
jgi:hypothetical protein